MNIHSPSPRTRQSISSVLYNVRMHTRTFALTIASFILGTTSIAVAYAWSGPTAAPPNGNVAAPINVGSTDQVKSGGLGVNSLAVFGNSLLGGSAGSNSYLNFGVTSGESGYGMRDNDGTLEFKNDGGTWQSIQNILYALCGGECGGGSATSVSFSANKNGTNQTVSSPTSGAWTKLTWSTESFDTNNNFANDRFTPTVAGTYIIHLQAQSQTMMAAYSKPEHGN
jgi:hypothetical protein